MLVAEYEYRFMELSHFLPALVADQEERCQMFLEGLRPKVRHLGTHTTWKVFADLVVVAKRVELGKSASKGQGRRRNRSLGRHGGRGYRSQTRLDGQVMFPP
ncbi:hypothetical protein CFOL_v3_27671 [Cephalotus follicularis]|uniref:Retrotransposon gag domain-containing protein n=1 Tax=Cephalotus follicularis TaxID=3775 RepID=A0A1Q3CVG9_CEPFO|nr:hypothetical protein CFOL_v3_27671 [Cephalotus follicularis]